MATCTAELDTLIARARAAGATVTVTYDLAAKLDEGRDIIETVQVVGLGIGPHPMSALGAAERLREALGANLRAAFEELVRAGMAPTWAGDHVIANVPGFGFRGTERYTFTTPEVVRNLRAAFGLIHACN